MKSILIGRAGLFALALTLVSLGFLSLTLAAPNEQSLACINAAPAADPSPTVCISNMIVVFDGTSPDNQFIVSWRTAKNERGQVKLSSGEIFDDVRGADYQGKTHYVVVSKLDAKTKYTFDIISGDKIFSNNNAHWQVRTGPALQAGTPYIIFGRVSNPDGSDADGTIVYAQVRDGDDKGTQGRAAWLSGLIVVADGGNFFNIDVENARTNNYVQKYAFSPEGDRVFIHAVGAQGTAEKTFKLDELHPPAAPPSFILGSGTGSAVTATATQQLPTNTSTPSPTHTFTHTPVSPTPTFTHTPIPPSATPAPVTETAQAEATTIQEQATQTQAAASTETAQPQITSVAFPAGEEVEPQRTRIFGGVPNFVPPEESSNNFVVTLLALVCIVGAVLLGLAAFFITRSKT